MLFSRGHKDARLPATLLRRKNAPRSIPIKFAFPAATVGRLSHHTKVLEKNRLTGFCVVDGKVRISGAAGKPTHTERADR